MVRFFKIFLFGSLSLVLGSCITVQNVRTGLPTTPVYQVHPDRVLLLNTYDASTKNYRKNKEQFFMVLVDKALLDISREIQKRTGSEASARLGLTPVDETESARDNLVMELMNENQASDAIVITDFTVYFEQTDVVVTQDNDGSKSREAFYDIISNIRYVWYNQEGVFKNEEIKVRRFHSTRSVASGLLAFGPNVVKQKDDVYSIVEENNVLYLNLFLPGIDFRLRPVFTGGEFAVFKQYIDANDYEKALEEAVRLIDNPSRKVAAQANYNAAVMSERLGRYTRVKKYLQESSRLYRHQFSRLMLMDY